MAQIIPDIFFVFRFASISFFLTYILLFPIHKISNKYGLFDRNINYEKENSNVVRLGGIAIFFGSFITLLLNQIDHLFLLTDTLLKYLIVFSTLIFLIGLIDDFKPLSPRFRLFIQVLISSQVWLNLGVFRYPIEYLPNFISSNNLIYLPLSFLITIIWIVGITNALNWFDGLDGLLAGKSIIILGGITYIFYLNSSYTLFLYCVSLLGACLGFLILNFKPAKILMGDGGSNFLGFNIALLSLAVVNSLNLESQSLEKYPVLVMILPFIILSIPIFDMVFVILKRIFTNKPPFYPDNNHLHHRLMKLGLSYERTIFAIFGLNLVAVLLFISLITLSKYLFLSTFVILLVGMPSFKKFFNKENLY